MNPNKKLLLLFLLDCLVISLFLVIAIFILLGHLSGIWISALFLISLYYLTRYYMGIRRPEPPVSEMSLPEKAKRFAIAVGIASLFTAATTLKEDALNSLLTNIPFLCLLWAFCLLICLYRYARDLEKLKSTPASGV